MFREIDTDDIFSFSWGFRSRRFQTPNQSVSITHLAYKILHCLIFSIFFALIRYTKFIKRPRNTLWFHECSLHYTVTSDMFRPLMWPSSGWPVQVCKYIFI